MSPVFSSLHRQSSQEIIGSLVLLWVKLITFFASIPLDYSLLCGGYFYWSLFFFLFPFHLVKLILPSSYEKITFCFNLLCSQRTEPMFCLYLLHVLVEFSQYSCCNIIIRSLYVMSQSAFSLCCELLFWGERISQWPKIYHIQGRTIGYVKLYLPLRGIMDHTYRI